MQREQLQDLEEFLYSPVSIPIIDRCLKRRVITFLAEDNSRKTTEILVKAVTCLEDRNLKKFILDALTKLKNQDCIDCFCMHWANERHEDLTKLLIEKAWVASKSIDVRILTALKTNQLEVITSSGKEIVEPLLNTFQDKDTEIANLASECAINLTDSEAIDYICQMWVQTRDRLLEQIICKGRYVAGEPNSLKVLTALKVAKLEVITNGDKEVVKPLLNAFQDKDPEIANRARKCVDIFEQPEYKEFLCYLVIYENHPIASQVAIEAQYAPHEPSQRAIFYFLTEQWDKYESLDHDYTLLQTIYQSVNEIMRRRIADKARRVGRVEWIDIVINKVNDKELNKKTDTEWEAIVSILIRSKNWEKILKLAQKAPPIWTRKILLELNNLKINFKSTFFDNFLPLIDKFKVDPFLIGTLEIQKHEILSDVPDEPLIDHSYHRRNSFFNIDSNNFLAYDHDSNKLILLNYRDLIQYSNKNREYLKNNLAIEVDSYNSFIINKEKNALITFHTHGLLHEYKGKNIFECYKEIKVYQLSTLKMTYKFDVEDDWYIELYNPVILTHNYIFFRSRNFYSGKEKINIFHLSSQNIHEDNKNERFSLNERYRIFSAIEEDDEYYLPLLSFKKYCSNKEYLICIYQLSIYIYKTHNLYFVKEIQFEEYDEDNNKFIIEHCLTDTKNNTLIVQLKPSPHHYSYPTTWGKIYVYKLSNFELLHVFNYPKKNYFSCDKITLSRNGKFLAVSSMSNFQIISLYDYSLLGSYNTDSKVTDLFFLENSRYLITINDRLPQVWVINDHNEIELVCTEFKKVISAPAKAQNLAISTDLSWIAYSEFYPGSPFPIRASYIITSKLLAISRLPINSLNREHIEWLEKSSKEDNITVDEYHWISFILHLHKWNHKYDIYLEEEYVDYAPQQFDIEI